jgi:hypothetical protein
MDGRGKRRDERTLPGRVESGASVGLLSVRQIVVLSVAAGIAFISWRVPGTAGPMVVFFLVGSLLNRNTE